MNKINTFFNETTKQVFIYCKVCLYYITGLNLVFFFNPKMYFFNSKKKNYEKLLKQKNVIIKFIQVEMFLIIN